MVQEGGLSAGADGEGGQQLLVGAHLLLDSCSDLLRILAAQRDDPDQGAPQDLLDTAFQFHPGACCMIPMMF